MEVKVIPEPSEECYQMADAFWKECGRDYIAYSVEKALKNEAFVKRLQAHIDVNTGVGFYGSDELNDLINDAQEMGIDQDTLRAIYIVRVPND